MSQRSAKKVAHKSISADEFCKDVRKFACFRTEGRKWAWQIMKTVKKSNIWYILTHPNIKALPRTKNCGGGRLTIVSAGWWFPGCPVGPDGSGAQPLPVHQGWTHTHTHIINGLLPYTNPTPLPFPSPHFYLLLYPLSHCLQYICVVSNLVLETWNNIHKNIWR